MSASRTIPSRSPTITPHIETVCANNTRICPTNSDKRASSPLYPGSMASNSISVSVNLNAAPDTAESNYLPLQNLCRWGSAILSGPITPQSHGAEALRRYRAGGARAEAAAGFPHVYEVGLPALRSGRFLTSGDENAARVHACFALLATLEDTNLLHRSGEAGLRFARRAARDFLGRGGVGQVHWQSRAAEIHHEFIARRLSPGGCADLLAMSLLVDALETPEPLRPPDHPVGARETCSRLSSAA